MVRKSITHQCSCARAIVSKHGYVIVCIGLCGLMLDSPPKPGSSASSSSSGAAVDHSSEAAAASTAPTKSTSELEFALGPHSFNQKQEGANAFLRYMKSEYPLKWHSIFGINLLCPKSGQALWAPKTCTAMTWDSLCRKVTAYLWSVDKALQKCSAKKFPGALWQRYVDEVMPVTGKDPRLILVKLYHYANLAPPGVTRRP